MIWYILQERGGSIQNESVHRILIYCIDMIDVGGSDRGFRGRGVCDFWQYQPKKKYNTDEDLQEDMI